VNAQVIPIPESLPQFRRPPGLPMTCSDATLLDAVKASLCGSGPEDLAPMLGVPVNAVRHWVASKEWNQLKQWVWPDLKGLVHTELVSIRSNLIMKIAQRVKEGDPQYDMRGEFVGYREIKAKDLGVMLLQTSEVIHQIEKEIGVIRDDDGKISLHELAAGLKAYARDKDMKTINAEK
jgi:hypothetical protein